MYSLSGIQSQPFLVRPLRPSAKRLHNHFRIPNISSLLKTSRPGEHQFPSFSSCFLVFYVEFGDILSAFGEKVSEVGEDEDVMRAFLKDRELNGDVIARVCDKIWLRSDTVAKFDNYVAERSADVSILEAQEMLDEESEGGFLKLTTTNEWLKGDNAAPVNRKLTVKEMKDDRDRRRRLSLLKYEALKSELLFLTVGIGTACSGYCLFTLSIQASLSYATGVVFSCLYLVLLFQHADNIAQEKVPQIFRQKKAKKIGIRSQDLQDLIERTVKGSGIALSSPRLVLPAAIYGLWELCQHFAHDLFDFQLVPAMVGLFAYKAAALVQVYRDNEDLQFIFPDNEEGSQN